MVWLVKRISLIGALIAGLAMPAFSQGAYSVAYRVNQGVISNYDISQRMKLFRALGDNRPNARQNAIDALIDDRLKAEAAQNFGIAVDQASLARSIENYAQQRNLSAQQLMSKLRSGGVARESFEEFLSVSLVWNSLLRGRFGDQAQPSEIDLNAQLNTYAVSSATTIQLGEIVLPYLGRGQDATVALATQIISQVRGGESFTKLARQYSQSATAADGGVIGWVSPNRLPPQIAASVRGLGRGKVAEPIFIPSGIVIIAVLDARTVSQQIEVPVSVKLTYAELIIPFATGGASDAATQANRLRRSLDGCRGLEARAADYAQGSGVFGPASLGNIDTDIGLALARLDPRESTVLQSSNALRVLVLCDRVSEMSVEGRDALRNQLFSRNLAALSEGYLLELRRNSIITPQ